MAKIYDLMQYKMMNGKAAMEAIVEQKVVNGVTTRVRKYTSGQYPVKPFISAGPSVTLVRDSLVKAIESFAPDVLLLPATKDLDPVWSGVRTEQVWANSLYPPFTHLHQVLRYYTSEFIATVKDFPVYSQQDYHRTLNSFNELYMRGLDGRGSGNPRGTLSVDQAIRMAALFYAVINTADAAGGLQVDIAGHVCNEWSGRQRVFDLNFFNTGKMADRLSGVYFAGLPMKQFLARVIPEYASQRGTWLFDLSDVDVFDPGNYAGMGYQDLIELIDITSIALSSQHHQTIIVLPYTDQLMDAIRGVIPKRLHIETKLGKRTCIVTNFDF